MDDNRLFLTDRGIRQALDSGLLKFYPPLEDRQIQPASLDLLLDSVVENFPIDERCAKPWEGNVLLPNSQVELRTSQRMEFAQGLGFYTELRSSLRRLSCYTPSGITMMGEGDHVHVEVYNPGRITVNLARNDKIAQLVFCFSKFSAGASLHKSGFEGYEAEAEVHEKLLLLDSGYPVRKSSEARKLLVDGYFAVTPEAKFEKGLLCVHAGDNARVLRQDVVFDFSAKTDLSGLFEEVRLPYRLRPSEHLIVDAVESFELSSHVALQFYGNMVGTRSMISPFNHSFERAVADFKLSGRPDGWIDPGYKGAFSRQPKTFFEEGVLIRPGMCLGHGLIIFYPNGVERPYGSQGLNSHYQNATTTDVIQNRNGK